MYWMAGGEVLLELRADTVRIRLAFRLDRSTCRVVRASMCGTPGRELAGGRINRQDRPNRAS